MKHSGNHAFNTVMGLLERLDADQARGVIKSLVKLHGGECLDRATDELIEEEQDLDFPEIVE